VKRGPPPKTRRITKLVKQKRKISVEALKIAGIKRGRVIVLKLFPLLAPKVADTWV
jgi:hypothetical protein